SMLPVIKRIAPFLFVLALIVVVISISDKLFSRLPPSNAQAVDITNGLVGHWKFDEGSGTTAADSSGNNNTGTLVNGPTWTEGKVGQALSFDGVNNHVHIASDMIGINTVTACAWINVRSVSSKGSLGTIITNLYFEFYVFYNNPTYELLLKSDLTGKTLARSASSAITLNTWQHVCCVRQSGTNGLATLYVDGSQSGAADQSSGTPLDGFNYVQIG